MKFTAILTILALVLFSSGNTNKKNNGISKETTTFYLVRHAEKDTSVAENPPLTETGIQRAKSLAIFLEDKNVAAVYSTNYKRTKSTAKFTAESNTVVIQYYQPGALYSESFLEKHKGETVLIVGHSNTIPSLVNKILGENRFDMIPEKEYDHLYIVTIKDDNVAALFEKM
ncbi:phosphoglycerate mutase family protein [Patiriisocius sp. Uisw_017]|jgi:broad specificity phosphatase PhoE|uniref:phosphoglycerate mutase family protein n=1 Tax=Patiriisocius sp. Uisw_017 TaxID=3230968 RepID=UPI0039E8DC07